MEDSLVMCPKCGSDACYKTPINEFHSNYSCFGYGFQTSDLIREGEFNFEEYVQSLPYLYVDIKHIINFFCSTKKLRIKSRAKLENRAKQGV